MLRPTGKGSNFLKVIVVKVGVQFTIGRNAATFVNEQCTECVDGLKVSRRHATLDIIDGELYINCVSRLVVCVIVSLALFTVLV